MNKSGSGTITAHRKVGQSTTLNRKYVQRPGSRETREQITEEYRAEQLAKRQARAEAINRQNAERLANRQRTAQTITTRVHRATQVTTAPKPTASELKEAAIKKALKTIEKDQPAEEKTLKTSPKFGVGRILLALGCATVSILAIAYLININMPEFSLRVAAMQTGIEPTYPNYVPAGYNQNSISAEGDKIAISFKHSNGNAFTLSEEKSSWDSTTLLNNYIKPEFKEDYSTIREHGLTIYITPSAAAWINGGIAYKLTFNENSLTKNQIISLATSL